MTAIAVRRATEIDVPDILPLWKEMMAFHAALDSRFRPAPGGDAHWAKAISAWMQDEDNCVLVAEVEGRIVGYIVGMMREHPPGHDARAPAGASPTVLRLRLRHLRGS